MNLHFEPTSGNIRLFDDGSDFGDPYEWCCRVDIVGSSAFLSMVQSVPHGVRDALKQWGRDHGITEFCWLRKKSGQSRKVTIKI